MSDTENIKFRVSQEGANETKVAFDKLDKSRQQMIKTSEQLTPAVKGNSQAMIEFGRILQDAPYGINGVTNNITRLAEVSGVGGPLLLAISAVSSAAVIWSNSNRGAKDSIDLMTEAIETQVKSLFKLKENQYEFLVKPEDVQAKLSQVTSMMAKFKSEAEYISAGAGSKLGKGGAFAEYFTNLFASGKLTDSEERRLKILEEIQKQLTKNKDTLEAQLEISQVMGELGVNKTPKGSSGNGSPDSLIGSWDKSMGSLVSWVHQLANAYKLSDEYAQLLIKDVKQIQPGNSSFLTPMMLNSMQKRPTEKYKSPLDQYGEMSQSEILRKEYPQMVDGFNSAMAVIHNNWNTGWESMIGETNSMFEQMMSGWAEKLFDKFSNTALDWALSFIPGGSILSKAFGVGGGGDAGNVRMQGGSSGSGITVIELKMGGSNETLARWVARGSDDMSKLRITSAY